MPASARTRGALARAWSEVAESTAGKIVIRDLLNIAGFLNIDAEPLAGDEALFRAGKRAIAATVLHRLQWSEAELLALGEAVAAEQILNAEELRALDEQDMAEDLAGAEPEGMA